MAEMIRKHFVLVFFFQEKKYSILKLKDAISPSELENFNLSTWDQKKTVETKWNDALYPAKFLQFGENRNEMEKLIDSLVDGSITSDEIPIVQSVQKEFSQTKRVRLHQQEAVSNGIQQQSKRQKLAGVTLKKNMKQQSILNSVKRNLKESICSKCTDLKSELSHNKRQIADLEAEVQAKAEEVELFRQKYKNMKKKYKSHKQTQIESNNVDIIKIGNNLSLEKSRLALCRVGDYSKYVCDMMDVVFGREVLGQSVLKGLKGSSKQVLDPNLVSDIQGHVAAKFNVNAALVRASMRNKLNTASKAEIAAKKLQ